MSETTGNSETGDYPKSEQQSETEEHAKAEHFSEVEQGSTPEDYSVMDAFKESNEHFDIDAFQSLYEYLERLFRYAKRLDMVDEDCFEDYRETLPRFLKQQQLLCEQDSTHGINGAAECLEINSGRKIATLVGELAFDAVEELDEYGHENLFLQFDSLQGYAGEFVNRIQGVKWQGNYSGS